jgi:nucleolar protein 14
MPEAINFLALVLLLLTPHSYTRTTLPGFIPANDFDAERCAHLKIRTAKGAAKALKHNASPELSSLLLVDEGSEQAKVDLLSTALQLVVKYAELYAGIEAFVEIFRPIQELLAGVKIAKLSPALQTVHTKTHDYLSNTLKFSLQARRPLLLQAHKPIPIASFIPKFEGSSYSHTKRYDPDAERNAASKLRSQYKQERKGAIRELRKDARFLATERNREKDEKDAAYDQRMRSVHGAITVERAEEKAMEREKARDKRRAGK